MSTEVEDGEERKRKQNDARNRAVFILFAAYLKLCGMINGQGGGSALLANQMYRVGPQTGIQPITAHFMSSVPRYRPRCTNQRHPAKYSQRSILLFGLQSKGFIFQDTESA